MNKYKLFLLDMDGTIYLGDEVFKDTIPFLNYLKENNLNYVFMTNNSSKSQAQYIEKLNRLNIPSTLENIYSSSMASASYLNEHYPKRRVFCLGNTALKTELKKYNINIVDDNPDVILVGFDTELNYAELTKTTDYLTFNDFPYIACNPDYVCPMENGRFIVDCGSICEAIEHATKKTPFFIGKPNPLMIYQLMEKYNVKKEEVLVVGDRIYTDIKSGINAGVDTCLVLSGETTLDILNESKDKPTYVFNDIGDLLNMLMQQ